MSKTVQWKRGNTAINSTYIGAQGEITVNTDNYNLYVHDGVTAGGYEISNTTDSNVSVGNLNIVNQTISGTVANANIILAPNGSGIVYADTVRIGNLSFTSNTINSATTANISIGTLGNTRVITGNLSVQNQLFTVGADRDLLISHSNTSNVVTFSTAGRPVGNSDIRIQANVNTVGLYLSTSYATGAFNAYPLANYTFTVGGSTRSNDYYALASVGNVTGYYFISPSGLTTGLVRTGVPGIGANSVVQITQDGANVASFYDNLTTVLGGNLVVSAENTYGSFPNAFIATYANVNSYSQIVNQNLNSGSDASTDFVATANNGNDSTYYINMGIDGSGHADPGWFANNEVNSGYLYVVGYNDQGPSTGNVGNLIIGSTNGQVKTFVGNTSSANVVTVVSTVGLLPGANVAYDLGSTSRRWRTIWGNQATVGTLVANTVLTGNAVSLSYESSNNTALLSTGSLSNADLKLVATNGGTGGYIFLRANTNRMSFNTTSDAFDFNFNGELSATDYTASANSPTGYAFYTGDNKYSGFSHVNGAISYLRISHDNTESIKFWANNFNQMIGSLQVLQDANISASLPNAFISSYANVNSYSQLTNQNTSNGASASTDFVATADNGDDSTYYINMGIDGSGHAVPDWFEGDEVNSGYLYVVGYDAAGPSTGNVGNLLIGSTNGQVKTFVGNTASANVITTVTTTGLTVNRGNLTVSNGNAPTTAGSQGTAGQFAWDANYVYVCVAANTWKRANLSTW
jgi:hypothetical protein